jgi:preprotein translocase subunit SecG
MYYILIGIHVIVCLFLIASILLQAGRGGGLTEAFGGSSQSVLGTQAPEVLKKATEISAVVFLIVSLVLAMITARRGRSLFEQMKVPAMVQQAAQQAQQMPEDAATTVKTTEGAVVPQAVETANVPIEESKEMAGAAQ